MKKYVVIIQCAIARNRCSGFACTQTFYDRKDSFSIYDENTQYLSFTCGGCCGKGVTAQLENLSRRMTKMVGLKKEDVAIHLSSCIVTDNHHSDRCPHVDFIKQIIDKHGFDAPVEGSYLSKTASTKRAKGIYRSY